MIAFAALAFAAISAQAGMNITVRGDYVNTPKFKNRTDVETAGSSIFKGSYARASFDGKVGEATVSGRLDLGATGSYTADTLVEYLFLTKDFGNGFLISAGKLDSMTGGIESAMWDTADVYLPTLANSGVGGNTIVQLGSITTGSEYITGIPAAAGDSRGVNLTYKMDDNKFDLVVTNASNHGGNNVGVVGPTYRRHNIGFFWSGSFMDKMIEPALGYTSGAADVAQHGTAVGAVGYEEKQMNVGAKMKFDAFGATVEYLKNDKKANTTGAKEDYVTSIYALLDYTVDMWKPFLKIESSEFKRQTLATDALNDADSFKRTGVNLGVEITPKAGEAFRYHVSYASTSDKYKESSATQKETVAWSQVMIGMKYSADLLK